MQVQNLVFPLFIVIFLGYALKRAKLFSDSFGSELNRLVYYVALPLLLFSNMLDLRLEDISSLALVLGFPLVILATMILSSLISLFLKRHRRGAFIQGSFRVNLAYFGLPITLAVLGKEASGIAAVLVGVGTMADILLSVAVLRFYDVKSSEEDLQKAVISFLVNPSIVSIVAGFFFSYLRIPLPEFLSETLSLVSRTSLPLILFIIGFSLSFQMIKESIYLDVFSALIKLLIMPVLDYLIMLWFFDASGTLLYATVLMAAAPTAMISYTFAREFNADEKLAGSIVNFSALLSLVTIPMIIYLLFR